MMKHRPLALFLFGVVGLASIASLPSSASPPPRRRAVDDRDFKGDRFGTVLGRHFATWDRDRTGRLTVDRVNRIITDNTVKGDAAAAIAAIHLYQVENKAKAVVIDKELVDRIGMATGTGKPEPLVKAVQDNYRDFSRHLREVPRKLFVDEKHIGLKDLQQGSLGDCYLVAAVGGAVYRNPQAIRKIFHGDGDSGCDLVFPTGQKVKIAKLTDAEIVLGSTAGMQGLWTNYMEKGIGMLSGKSKVATDNIDGGSVSDVITLLTGHEVETVKVWKKDKVQPTEGEAANLVPKIRGLLDTAQQKHWVVVAATDFDDKAKTPAGIAHSHAYAVLGFDAKKGEVHLWNPWGNTLVPKEPGLENGYPTRGGEFFVPLKDFVRLFCDLYHETDKAHVKKKK